MAAELNKEKFEIMMETALNRFNLNQYDETVCDIEGTYSIEGNKITIEYSSNIYGREWAQCYNMPEDFSEYEEYMNFTTNYEISDNDLFINITIPEYSNYYYYLIIKINRY